VTAIGRNRCEGYRDALLDFVDRREIRPATASALDHLGRCANCARDLEVTALAIVGLRRLYDEVGALEPPTDAWDRLRSRITRPSAPVYSVRSPVMGMLAALAIVIAVTAPGSILDRRFEAQPGASAVVTTGDADADDRVALIERQLTRRRQPPSQTHPITILVPLEAPPSGVRLVGPDGRGYRLVMPKYEPRPDSVE
jgi:hypothetical protein